MSLKVCPHPRGHVASCNGSLDDLKTRVESDLHDPRLSAAERAALVQEWTLKERERKVLKLAQFQKDVKSRVNAREKLIQQEMAATSRRAMISEQEAAERALKLDNTKVQHSVARSHDVEDVKTIASGRESHFSQYQTPQNSSPLQAARKALLSQSHSHCNNQKENTIITENSLTPSQKPHSNYHSVAQLSPEMCSRKLSMECVGNTCGRARYNQDSLSPRHSARNFTAPGQIEHMERIQAGKQYLVFRRLYSELEREQVRKKKMQDSHSRHVKAVKKKKEANRKMVEEEVNSMDSCSIISTSISEEKQMATEWAELMLLEERKQELQKSKETERYMAALKVRLKELVALKKVEIPPLCPVERRCGILTPRPAQITVSSIEIPKLTSRPSLTCFNL